MKILKFTVNGIFNSFRIPFFRNYHKTFLAPPKTTIVGMLCNISLKSNKEFYEILSKDIVQVAVIISKIDGLIKDLWKYKTLNTKNMGSSILNREKLFNAKYQIYLKTNDEKLFNEFLNNLKNPLNTPSLGMDDEMIKIFDVEEVQNLNFKNSKNIHSIFANIDNPFTAEVKDYLALKMPTNYKVATKFEAFDKKGDRKPKEILKEGEVNLYEFYGCDVNFDEEIPCFYDEKSQNNIIFY